MTLSWIMSFWFWGSLFRSADWEKERGFILRDKRRMERPRIVIINDKRLMVFLVFAGI